MPVVGNPLKEYSSEYWDNYYSGSYEETFSAGFSMPYLLRYWERYFDQHPTSFADIGCGPGQTLQMAKQYLPPGSLIYGVESQPIPRERQAHHGILFGDFLDIADHLPQVDLLYVACSMYIPWDRQEPFLRKSMGLARKAVVFANLYLQDRYGIPEDRLRQVIYSDRGSFAELIGSNFPFRRVQGNLDFFVHKENDNL